MRSPAGAMIRELLAESQTDPAALELFRERFFDRRRSHASDAVRRGIDMGHFRPDLDIPTVIDTLYAPLWLRLIAGHAPLTPKAIERIVDTVLGGIATR